MLLATPGESTVFWVNVSLVSPAFSAHIARPSSLVLRRKLFSTVESVIAPSAALKLTPSAVVSSTVMPLIVRSLAGPTIHAPTFVFWIHTLEIVELLKPPLNPLTDPSLSTRVLTLPKMARFETLTLVLGLPICPANSTLDPVNVVYHWPAPSTVTLLTFSGLLIVYVPCGM